MLINCNMPDYIPFGWFYLANLLVGSFFLVGYGIRKKYSSSAWLTIVATLMTLFIAGIKLMGYPIHEWSSLITSSSGEPAYSKFVPGGILFFAIGLMLVQWLMKFRTSIMDSMILVLPWMVVIQRTGCFINGCCYGKPADLPWAVSYPSGTSAFEHYTETGETHAGELFTFGLHPAQLYMVIGALLAWFIIWKTRRIWKSKGSRAIFGMLLLSMIRFVVEFFRETPETKWYSQSYLGINYLQWTILILALVFTAELIRKERGTKLVAAEIHLQEDLSRTVGLLFIVILLIWNLRRLFEIQELLLLQVLVTAALAVTVYQLYLAVTLSLTKLGLIMISLIGFTTMSQALIKTEADSIRKDTIKTWFNFSVAGSTGRYEHRMRDCSGNITQRELMNQATGGVDFSYHYQPNDKNKFDFGARGWISDIDNLSNKRDSGYFTYGINPYINYNQRSIGLGLGLTVFKPVDYYLSVGVLPSVYLRLGPEDRFFVDAGFQDQMMLNGHLSNFHIGLGSGFKTQGQAVFRTGVSFAGFENGTIDDQANFYLTGDFRIDDRFLIKPGLYLGNKTFGVLSLSYKFGFREKLTQ